MDQPQPPPMPEAQLEQPLASDLPCAHCGYNLRGLRTNALCPECETPVDVTRDRLLGNADGRWLARLRNAALLVFLTSPLCYWRSVYFTLGRAEPDLPFGETLVPLIAGLMNLVGVVLLTSREPACDRSPTLPGWRPAARWSATLAYVVYLGLVLERELGALPATAVRELPAIVGLVAGVSMLIYLRGLARRIPDRRLGRASSIVMWGWGAVNAFQLMFVAVFVYYAADRMTITPPGATSPVMPVVLVAGSLVGGLLFGLWYIYLLLCYYLAFRRAAQASEWQSESGVGAQPMYGRIHRE